MITPSLEGARRKGGMAETVEMAETFRNDDTFIITLNANSC